MIATSSPKITAVATLVAPSPARATVERIESDRPEILMTFILPLVNEAPISRQY
jgi:hypothetical protein